jgi:Holliday junction resolvase RusA-like endonuclease
MSYNSRKRKKPYHRKLQREFNKYKEHYDEKIPLEVDLSSYLVYIYDRPEVEIGDVDNISKPIIDAFKTVIYKDDNLVRKRCVEKMKYEDYEMIEIDFTNVPYSVFNDYQQFIENKEKDIILLEVKAYY